MSLIESKYKNNVIAREIEELVFPWYTLRQVEMDLILLAERGYGNASELTRCHHWCIPYVVIQTSQIKLRNRKEEFVTVFRLVPSHPSRYLA